VRFVTTLDAAPFAVHGNVGWSQNPNGSGERAHVVRVSSALMWTVNERLTLAADAGAVSSTDRSRNSWPGTFLVGAIYMIRPGLNIDVGYQTGVHAPVSYRQWLFGLTYRFAESHSP
jgi:hypothetical protein